MVVALKAMPQKRASKCTAAVELADEYFVRRERSVKSVDCIAGNCQKSTHI